MGTEIERKFLVKDESWRSAVVSETPIIQGYLCCGPPTAARVRIAGSQALLNIKKATLDIVRAEFEYPIPLADAQFILDNLCLGTIVEKKRHKVPFGGFTWEIDVFEGMNKGLVIAEIELGSTDQVFEKPPWLNSEVSGDARYLNTSLSRNPYALW